MDDIERTAGTHEALPLFPLPEYTLFPHTLAPFHVFEPRYVGMLDHCLADRRLLVVAGLEPGWQERYHGTPPVFRVAGLARVVSDRRLRDGRTNIFVHCVQRVRILREREQDAYRLVDVEPLPDLPDDGDAALVEARDRVVSLVASLARELGPDGAFLGKVLASSDDPGVLSHRLAGVVVDDPMERQSLLECMSPAVRCRTLADHVVRLLMERTATRREGAGWIN
ncbi:MAG: LON peptidase substrate-binding domain-containing protein [Myxococcota bacterium]